jgi:cytochrome c-type biogenesis protein CcmH/NrfF
MVTQPDGTTPKQYTIEEIQNYADLVRQLPCPVCQRTTLPLNGSILSIVRSFLVFTYSRKKPLIACPDCLNKKNNLAITTTALLGWWGFPWGLIKTPQYIYQNVMAKKQIKRKQPNDVLLSLTFMNAAEIEANKNNPEKLKEIIKPKKSWWLP